MSAVTRHPSRLETNPLDVMLLWVRWYVAYSLSLRNLEEMMAERGIAVDHSTVHRWVIKLVPLFEKTFRRQRIGVGNGDSRPLPPNPVCGFPASNVIELI
jgi:transposase-like protein